MTNAPEIPVPRAGYGLVMVAATLIGAGVSWVVAAQLGADPFTLRTVLMAAAIGALPTLAPAVLNVTREHWGVCVMGAGVTRLLFSLGYCYAARASSPELLARPLFVGVVAGAMLLLIVEAIAAIKILSAIERRRQISASADSTHSTNRKLA